MHRHSRFRFRAGLAALFAASVFTTACGSQLSEQEILARSGVRQTADAQGGAPARAGVATVASNGDVSSSAGSAVDGSAVEVNQPAAGGAAPSTTAPGAKIGRAHV